MRAKISSSCGPGETPPVCGNTGVPSGMGSPDADGSGVASGGMAGEGAGVGEGVGEGARRWRWRRGRCRRLCWGRRYRFGWGWRWDRRRRRWLDRKADKVERKSIDVRARLHIGGIVVRRMVDETTIPRPVHNMDPADSACGHIEVFLSDRQADACRVRSCENPVLRIAREVCEHEVSSVDSDGKHRALGHNDVRRRQFFDVRAEVVLVYRTRRDLHREPARGCDRGTLCTGHGRARDSAGERYYRRVLFDDSGGRVRQRIDFKLAGSSGRDPSLCNPDRDRSASLVRRRECCRAGGFRPIRRERTPAVT